jgi:lipopolysaccharide/colanic/teichoic acid biosynthesis glycosyltransferase
MDNNLLISEEEQRMAEFLKKRNLDRTNEMSEHVQPRRTFYTRYVKRLLDISIAFPAFVLLLPLNLIFAVCTYFDVGRPVLYRQSRCGLNGKPFTLVKFRNMNNQTDKDGKLLPAAERVTKFGKIMRRYSLDELLNFWNVLVGDMSIIGPRPMPAFFEGRMSDRHKMRHAVRPGLECPKMITSKEAGSASSTEFENYHWVFENDIWYVENVSFSTDVKMFFLLVKTTLALAEREKHAEGASFFIGYDDNGEAIGMKAARAKYSI